ncbi:MAG: NUDIX domain-containing protein [Patescibacteria group bacterium]|nr:NUDIX domain-containing protein [Patescibacteria group bacterium]
MGKESVVAKEQFYRRNVSLITFKNGMFLLVNLQNWPPDYWKFPQGGVNRGETLGKAVYREFQEELGTDKIEIVSKSKTKRVYRWESPIVINETNFVGQKQTFFLIKFIGDDTDIHINSDEVRAFRWTTAEELEALIKKDYLDFLDYWKTVQAIILEAAGL